MVAKLKKAGPTKFYMPTEMKGGICINRECTLDGVSVQCLTCSKSDIGLTLKKFAEASNT